MVILGATLAGNKKKEKESNFKGRDADRPKGIGISPEEWFVRNEQNIMPKSFGQADSARPTLVFFLLFLCVKYKVQPVKSLTFSANQRLKVPE